MSVLHNGPVHTMQ